MNNSTSFNHGGASTTIAAVHTDVIESHILTKCDGASLACAASTSHLLHNLCNKESLWKDVCNSTWSSVKHPLVQKTISTFSGGYRSFFSDAFPIIRPNPSRGNRSYEGDISELISAVDIHYGDCHVFSKVVVTNTDDKSFRLFSFWVDMLDCKETVKFPLKYQGDEDDKCMLELEENFKLSWILIDPTRKRAVNVSSFRPVSVQPFWNGYDVQVIFASIVSGDEISSKLVECRIVATFSCKEGKMVKLRELNLYMEDMQTRRLSGEKSLKILEEAMERGERKKASEGEMKEMYENYLDLSRNEMERKERKDKVLNIVYRLSCVAYFFAFVFLCVSLNVFPN